MPFNPLDYLFYKPEPVKPTGPAKPWRIPQPLPEQPPVELSPGQQVFRKSLEALGGIGKGLFEDPAMPREEFEQTSPWERAGMLTAAAPLGATTGIKGLYSRVNRAIEGFPGKQINANRALNQLRNLASKEEIGYRGLDKFLQDFGGKAVPVEDVRAFAEAHPLQVKTKTYGRMDPTNTPLETWFYRTYGRHPTEAERVAPETIGDFERYHVSEPTRYDRYTLPGGKDYRETIISLNTDPQYAGANPEVQRLLDMPLASMTEEQVQAMHEADQAGQIIRSSQEPYRHAHWPTVDNPLAHVRYNERRLPPPPEQIPADILSDVSPIEFGPKGRFLEEVQSDWHEAGRDRGYLQPGQLEGAERLADQTSGNLNRFFRAFAEQEQDKPMPWASFEDWVAKEHPNMQGYIMTADTGEPAYRNLLQDYGSALEGERHSREMVVNYPHRSIQRYLGRRDNIPEYAQMLEQYENLYREKEDAQAALHKIREMVPDAPFKEDWPDLVLKQQLMDVAERPDLDWLGFTTGQTQIDRYDLSQVASRIVYDPQERVLEVYGPNMEHLATHAIEDPKELIPIIGKDAADRLLQNPVAAGATPESLDIQGWEPRPTYQLAGENLQIGGAGMTEFYDKQLPRKLEKLLAPFGGKVEKTQMSVPTTREVERRGTLPGVTRYEQVPSSRDVEIWYAKLSPEMKAAIREKGLPLLMALMAAEFGDDYAEE